MKNINDDVLVKYLLREATDEEQQWVQAWIAESDSNKQYYQQFKLIWDESKKLERTSTIDTHKAWERFKEKAEARDIQEENKARVIPFFRQQWFRAAAVLLVLAGSVWFIHSLSGLGSGEMLAQSFDEVLVKTLPDGSVVTLNKHTTLTYPANFTGDSRRVTLVGEAFFDITPNKAKPFIIDAGKASVRVVGTSFNVKARTDLTEVIVETGIVQVANEKNTVRLLPGNKATLTDKEDKPVTENVTDELYNYYRTDEFVCNATPLSKVVATLNEAYSANIVLAEPGLNNLLLTTTFHKESLDGILDIISQTLKLKVEENEGEIILKER